MAGKTKPEEEPDVLKDEGNLPKDTEGKDAIKDLMKSGLVRSAVYLLYSRLTRLYFMGSPVSGRTGMECSKH